MGDTSKWEHGEKGLSAGVLVVFFLVWVAVSAVFFSLGFLVGYNEQPSKAGPVTERITTTSIIPPTVNPPASAPTGSGEAFRSEPKETASAASASLARPSTEVISKPSPKPSATTGKATGRESRVPDSGAASGSRTGLAATGTAGKAVHTGFTVQVDALRHKQDAEALVKILKARHYPIFLVAPEYAHSKDNLYRVQVGPFTTREDAERVRDRLSQEGFKPFIKH